MNVQSRLTLSHIATYMFVCMMNLPSRFDVLPRPRNQIYSPVLNIAGEKKMNSEKHYCKLNNTASIRICIQLTYSIPRHVNHLAYQPLILVVVGERSLPRSKTSFPRQKLSEFSTGQIITLYF